MNYFSWISPLIIGLISVSTGFTQTFEGSLTLRFNDDDTDHTEILYTMKGPNVRLDFEGEDGSAKLALVLNRETNQAMFLMETLRMQMDFSMDTFTDEVSDEQTKITMDSEFEQTGRSRTIAGYACSEWKLTSTDEEGYLLIWIPDTPEFGSFLFPMGPGKQADLPDWAGKSGMERFFPFEVSDHNGKTILQVTGVRPHPVSDSLFDVPAGFMRMNMNLFDQ